MSRRIRFNYVSDNYEVNRALTELDNELAELEDKIHAEFEELESRISRIERFLRRKFLEEWEESEE